MSPFRLPSDLIGIGPGGGPGVANTPPPSRPPMFGGKIRMPEEGEEDMDLSSLMNYYRPQTYMPPAYTPNMGGMPYAPTFSFPVTIPRGSPGGPVGVGMPEAPDLVLPPGINPAAVRSGKLPNPEPEEEAPEQAMPMYRPGYVPPRPMNSNAFFSF